MSNQIIELIKNQKQAFEDFEAHTLSRIDDLELKLNSRGLNVSSSPGRPSDKLRADADKAFRAYAKGNFDPLKQFCIQNGMSVGSDPDGGFSVYPYVSAGMIETEKSTSPIRDLCRVEYTDSDEWEELIDKDTGTASWVGETASRSVTDHPELAKLVVPIHEIYTSPKITQKLLDDSSRNLGDWLVNKGASDFNVAVNTAFVEGNGIMKPKGMLAYDVASTSDASRAWGTLQYIATGASGAFDTTASPATPGNVLYDTIYSMKSGYRAGAWWLMNSTTAGEVRKLTDANGRYLWVDGLQAGQPNLLCGYPVRTLEDMPDIGADSYSIAFANLQRGYVIVERHGIKLLRDPYTDKPNVIFYMYRRIGGAVQNSEAIKLVKFGES